MNSDTKTRVKILREKVGYLINSCCNTLGCDSCGMRHFDNDNKHDGCEVTELEAKIMNLEFPEYAK